MTSATGIKEYKKSFMYSDDEDSEEDDCRNCGKCGLVKHPCWSWLPKDDNDFLLFLRESTVHGLRYIGQLDQCVSVRLFWALALLFAIGVSAYLIQEGVVEPLQANPVIISFQELEITIDQIPFPAVTICNVNKLRRTPFTNLSTTYEEDIYAYNADQTSRNVTILFEKYYAQIYLENFCLASESFTEHFEKSSFPGEERQNPNPNLNVTGSKHIKKYARPVFHDCEEMILLCLWEHKEVPCGDLFYPVQTEFGYCCSFNIMPQSVLMGNSQHRRDDMRRINNQTLKEWMDWDIDEDLVLVDDDNRPKKRKTHKNTPKHQRRPGVSSGLSIVLNPQLGEYISDCRAQESVGFRAQIHSSIDCPHVADFGKTIGPNSETFVNVRAEITLADPKVEYILKEERQCYFLNEYHLSAFKFYTQKNCVDECIRNLTFSTCECVRHFMPREHNQPLCYSTEHFDCIKKVKKNFTTFGVKQICQDCLPSCTQIRYLADTTKLPLRDDVSIWRNFSTQQDEAWASESLAIVHVFFSKESVESKVRKTLYGFKEIIANAGGLLGLTLGFSVISIVEPIYFITMRCWCQFKHKKSNPNGNTVLKNNRIHPKNVKFSATKILVNPADFIKWADPYAADPKMRPRFIKFPKDFIRR